MTNKKVHKTELKAQPFRVPNQYFDELKNDILEKTVSKKPKVIALNKVWFRAAAAVVLLISVGGGWLYMYQQQTSETELLAAGVEAELYSYDMQMLKYYSEEGQESELTNEDDAYLIQTGYANEEVLYGND
ncbi:MAG TPA: hypothetical protein VJ937_09390 [Salinivirga sp.]|uniref:hypothetical protein n=1 Tax=Salinivirga sp. TaxID=1970192 RepID=UPI002B48234A|nr:hypothetical protein [Salinivirga sp.]HKK59680.1 hypothetical protein [Salinivirga sp.]